MSRGDPPERQAQIAVVDYLHRVLPLGSKVAAIKNEHAPKSLTENGRRLFFMKRKAEGVLAGCPDLACFLPGGRVFLLEMKAPKTGTLSSVQQELHEDLAAIGHQPGIATCIDTARTALRAAGIPLRETDGAPTPEVKFYKAARIARVPADGLPF